ncbi:MAG: DUF3108 domain-containing protein [Gemmatimonadota bacterium]
MTAARFAIAALLVVGTAAGAQEGNAAPGTFPFELGERLEYEVRFRNIKVGQAEMELLDGGEIRGRPTFLARIRIRGGVPFYRVNDVMESWIDRSSLVSLRFREDIDEGSHERRRVFEMFPERSTFRQDSQPEAPSVADPLDETSFLYFVRTVPLEVGETYTFPRYFRPDRNPVIVKVLAREEIKVPAGTFRTIVVQPIIKTRGLFSEQGDARVWLSDDDRRMMVQMKSKSRIGSLNLYLRSHRASGESSQ